MQVTVEEEMRAILQKLHDKFNTRVYGASSYIKRDMRDRIAAVLERAALAGAAQGLYVEVRECTECQHIDINEDTDQSACNTCDWSGPSPKEDKCPGCNREGTMTTACPKCGARSTLLGSTTLPIPATAGAAQGAEPVGGAERWMAIVREKADDARKNAQGLRQFEGMEAEARARELAAQYLLETAHVMVLDERHAEALAGIVDQSGRIAELRAALTTAARAAEPEPWVPYLLDRADGVHGHYCIARMTDKGFRETWSPKRESWGAFSDTVFVLGKTPPTGTSQGEGTS